MQHDVPFIDRQAVQFGGYPRRNAAFGNRKPADVANIGEFADEATFAGREFCPVAGFLDVVFLGFFSVTRDPGIIPIPCCLRTLRSAAFCLESQERRKTVDAMDELAIGQCQKEGEHETQVNGQQQAHGGRFPECEQG